MRLLSSETVPAPFRRQIQDEVPDLVWTESASVYPTREEVAEAEVVFGLVAADALPDSSPLRWIQYPFAGVPEALCARAQERGILVTNVSGIYDRTIAEHVLGVMLALARRFDCCFELQREECWAHPAFPYIEDLAGQTAAIVGMGSLGQAIGRLLGKMGMRVIGCRRTLRPTPYVDRLYPVESLPLMARAARWLVIATPLTARTRGLISREVLRSLPQGARVVNVGRGAVMDHSALRELLESRHLAGAALDVFPDEPLAKGNPLWSLPNTILTPHCSANPADGSTASAEVLLRNLHRYRAGEPLENVVDLAEGY